MHGCTIERDGRIGFDEFVDNLFCPLGLQKHLDINADQLKDAFSKADTDGDGFVSILEFTRLLRQANSRMPSYKVINDFFNKADIDANSKLDFNEFSALVAGIKSGSVQGLAAVDLVEAARTMTPPSPNSYSVNPPAAALPDFDLS